MDIQYTFGIKINATITANSENLVSARAQKIKKPGHSKKEMASIKGKRKADASCSQHRHVCFSSADAIIT